MVRMRRILAPMLLLAACSSSSEEAGRIRSLAAQAADVAIGLVQPGEVVFLRGVGPGGGECGSIGEVRAFRTDRAVVFRVRDSSGFCFDTDVYKVALRHVTWKGEEGTMVFSTRGDPVASNAARARFFASADPDTAVLLPDVTVLQGVEGDAVILSLPLQYFGFWDDADDAQAVFDAQVLVERDVGGTISEPDVTLRRLLDFIDGP